MEARGRGDRVGASPTARDLIVGEISPVNGGVRHGQRGGTVPLTWGPLYQSRWLARGWVQKCFSFGLLFLEMIKMC